MTSVLAGYENNDRTSRAIKSDRDVVAARQLGRELATELGFSRTDQALIATAISELARNIVVYAGTGVIVVEAIHGASNTGLMVVAQDDGPGIGDIDAAMADGFSTGNSLGLGLPGTRRIVDEFDLVSQPGQGVTVTAIKWLGR